MPRTARAVQALARAISGLLEPASARSWAGGLAITDCGPCSGVEGREPNRRSICGRYERRNAHQSAEAAERARSGENHQCGEVFTEEQQALWGRGQTVPALL